MSDSAGSLDASHEVQRMPTSVESWLAVMAGRAPADTLRRSFSPDVILQLANRRSHGEDVIRLLTARLASPALSQVLWRRLPGGTAQTLTIRGTIPGSVMPSPGGPMSAMDYHVSLGEDGLIRGLVVHPHHLEPDGLPPPLPLGAVVPVFTLTDPSGHPTTLGSASPGAMVIVFTCNHCPWALGWHERLQRVARDYADRAVQCLQINANDPIVSPHDAIEASGRRVQAGAFAGPYLIDAGQRVARSMGARHTPEIFVLDAHRRLVYHGAPDGDSEVETEEAAWLRAALDQTLSGESVTVAETPPIGCTIKWTL